MFESPNFLCCRFFGNSEEERSLYSEPVTSEATPPPSLFIIHNCAINDEPTEKTQRFMAVD
ncbi:MULTISPECIES: hypothetical protein [unclassified Coleofasciculus]|uniref:hypothetical protein n=1 Tax=unclassified Coleofasciculus TaxID=2692782 RepID=UPI0018818165|nr:MULTISPECIES: hypothetical protein [unclassified Coleofasciculus]MBE9129080.1 hypothetical protein [Coleofasciculus sp. LEGE 07081]MBE9151879.1 hypothetical protein [Coleofasciculus sp. LEGE 07092]